MVAYFRNKNNIKRAMASFSDYPAYDGNDLGLTFSGTEMVFRVWSPIAEKAEILFYAEGTGADMLDRFPFSKGVAGTWVFRTDKNNAGLFYTYRVCINNKWSAEVVDPYAKFVGVNGVRAMVADHRHCLPDGWDPGNSMLRLHPESGKDFHPTDAVIYEMHLRDMTVHASSGASGKGKYKGLTEKGTVNTEGHSTVLSHLLDLGITHVQLLPVFDFHLLMNQPKFPDTTGVMIL